MREDNWVECDEMIRFINESVNSHDISIQVKTEPIVKHSARFSWPTTKELSKWYKDRARAMDSLTGQLDNCLSLLDFAICKVSKGESISEIHMSTFLFLCILDSTLAIKQNLKGDRTHMIKKKPPRFNIISYNGAIDSPNRGQTNKN
ncbi:hypothetical protein K1719_017912 [Acacia pycnantha]|nr:hypothetical protein K1719_017912 [Acacia pycnantha]